MTMANIVRRSVGERRPGRREISPFASPFRMMENLLGFEKAKSALGKDKSEPAKA
jgi:hypothetical protein